MINQLRHRTVCLLLFMVFIGPEMSHGQAPSARGDEKHNKSSAPAARLGSGPKAGEQFENSLGMKFVPVPGTDMHFCIWETRVQDYAAYAAANPSVNMDWKDSVYGGRVKVPVSRGPTYPVVDVSWNDAKAFCNWLTEKERREGKLTGSQSYRLPTDWEWSVAVGLNEAREGTPGSKDKKIPNVYPWGAQFPPPQGAGNFSDLTAAEAFGPEWTFIAGYRDGFATTSPVGSFAANKHGLFDLAGNVWEWCEDYYDDSNSSRVLSFRVLRGGSWFNPKDGLVSSYRLSYTPVSRGPDVGFRCVLAGGMSR